MSKILSSIGIGSAEVDTILPRDHVSPGETIEATVEIDGGSDRQEVDDVYFSIVTRYQTEEGYDTQPVSTFKMAEAFTIEPGEEREIPVSIEIPYNTPLTMGSTAVWIRTGLDIDWAVDPKDKDEIQVRPDDRLQAMFDAVEALGFSFHSSEVMKSSHGSFTSQSFVQEFEFKPHGGPFAGELDELELIPMPSEDEVDVIVEVDRRGGIFDAMGDWDETKTQMSFADADADALEEQFETLIREHL